MNERVSDWEQNYIFTKPRLGVVLIMGWLPKANWETALDYFRQIVRGCSRMVLARGGLSCPVPCECAPWEALQCRLKPLHFDGFQVLSCQVDPGWPRRLSSSGTSRWTSRSWKVTPSTAGARRRWRRAAGSRSTRTASSSRGKARGERPRCWTCHRWPGQDILKVGDQAPVYAISSCLLVVFWLMSILPHIYPLVIYLRKCLSAPHRGAD